MENKILVYLNSMNAFGGIERVVSNLSNELVKYYDITILVKDNPVSCYKIDDKIKIETLDTRLQMNMDSRFERIYNVFLNFFKSRKALRKYLYTNGFDVIYTTNIMNCLEAFYSGRKYRNKIIASEHASYFAYNKVYKYLKKIIYPKIKVVAVPTKTDTDIYIKQGYNAFYIPHLKSINGNYKLGNSGKTAINIGRLTNDKQQLLLLKIWEEATSYLNAKDWKLLIIGSGENKKLLENYIISHNMINVELVPQTKNIEKYYAKADLFLFTSKMEGFGMVLLEAMSYGIPCISFDCHSGPRDIIVNDFNGYLVPCYDKKKYVKKIRDYIDLNDIEKENLSTNARLTIEMWDNKEIMKIWIKLLNDFWRKDDLL